MHPFPKRSVASVLFLAATALAFTAPIAQADGCKTRFLRCIATTDFQDLEVGLALRKPLAPIGTARAGEGGANYTISTSGSAARTPGYLFKRETPLRAPEKAATASRLVLEGSKDGKPGDFALSLDNGARISVDMDWKKSYIKIHYKLDF